jgi:hypothetical protein
VVLAAAAVPEGVGLGGALDRMVAETAAGPDQGVSENSSPVALRRLASSTSIVALGAGEALAAADSAAALVAWVLQAVSGRSCQQ